MVEFNDIPLQQLPVRKKMKPKQKGYKPKAKGSSLLFQKSSSLKNLLKHSAPKSEDLGDAVAAMGELILLADKSNTPVLVDREFIMNPKPGGRDNWAAAASSACDSLISHSRRQLASRRGDKIGYCVDSRSAGFAMAMDVHGNSADFMRRAKYNGSTAPSHVQTRVKGGGFSTAPKDILKGLHGTFVDWYAPRKAGPGGGPRGGRSDVGDLYATLPDNQLECVAYSVSAKEFARALASAPSKSCPGPTGISIPLLKKFPPAYLETLRTMFNLILAWGLLPAVFNEGFIFPIPKKGVFSPDNCRPISLLEAHLKLLTRIVNRRLVYALLDADYFAEEQFGFLPGRSCSDAFHILLGALEDAAELDKEIHVTLVDLTKAFDSLSPESLRQAYQHAGMTPRTVDFLGSLDGTGKAKVLTPFGETDSLDMKWGVRQGEVLSPLKFITWLNPWLKHISATYPEVGYTMADGTRVTLLAYADDIAIITDSHASMQLIMDDLCDFLRYHGVTLSADDDPAESKTKYMTNRFAAGERSYTLHVDCFNRKSRPLSYVPADHMEIVAHSSAYVFVYLGGRLSLNLDWTEITRKARVGIDRELNRLKRKQYDLAEAAAVASSIVQGKAGYLLQLAPFPLSVLDQWDSKLNNILRLKAGSSYSASPAMFHAPKDKGGLGIFTFNSLANQSLGTELLVRLQSPTLSGKVARSRLHAMEERFPDHSRDRQPNTRYSFTLHCISRLRRIGYELATPANYRTLQAEYGGKKSLEDTGLAPQLLRSVTKLGFRFQSDLFDSDSTGLMVKAWEDIRCRAKAKNPTAWYTALLEFAETHSGLRVLDAFNTLLPRPSVTRTSEATRGYQPADIAARAAEAVEIRQGALAAAPALLPPFPDLLPPDINGYLWSQPAEIPPLSGGAVAAEFLFFATDGSVKGECGSYASVTPHRTAHWTQLGRREPGSKSLFYSRSGGRTQYGAEAVSIDAMELMAVVDVLEMADRNLNVYILTDSAYVMAGTARHSWGTRSLIRQTNRALWRRLTVALSQRQLLGARTVFAKCSSHGKDKQQHELISLWNSRADKEAELMRQHGLLEQEWWPEGDVAHTLLFHGKAVRGDPRLHIRRTNELVALYHAASLKRSSQLAALVTSVEPEVAMVPLRALRSATQLARAGFHSTQGFVHSMQNGALRTPVNLHAEPTGDRLTDFLPRDGHKVLCPLCGDGSPDELHYCSSCVSTAPIRTDLRAVVANLLSGVEAASFINMELVDSLIFWFTEYVQASPGDAYAFVDPTDFAGTVGVRILLGESASGALALSQPAPTRLIFIRCFLFIV